MKPQKFRWYSILIAVILFAIACSKNNDNVVTPTPDPDPPVDTAFVNFMQDHLALWSQLNSLVLTSHKAIESSDAHAGASHVNFDVCDAEIDVQPASAGCDLSSFYRWPV
jgi:hypothetical protein